MPAARGARAVALGDQRAVCLAAEQGRIEKPHDLPAALLVFANRYHVGMSNLGVQTLYRLIGQRADLRCERLFNDRALAGCSLETATPARRFPVWLVSIAFEMDYISLVRLLRETGVPPRAEERKAGDPIIVLGGMAPVMNPEPLAPFADAMYLGEIGDNADAFLDAIAGTARAPRADRLAALAAIPGVYIPKAVEPVYGEDGYLYEMHPRPGACWPIPRQQVADINTSRCVSQITTPHTEFAEKVLIEISRGCGRKCRFCFASFASDNRHVALDRLQEWISDAHAAGRAVGLVASDLSDYPWMSELVDFLVEREVRFSVSSVRAETVTDTLMRGMLHSGQRSITLAPEVATLRLQRIINKVMPEGEVLRKAERAIELGFRDIKLYFLLGVPREEWADVEALVQMARDCRDILLRHGRARGRVGRVIVSANPFVPKPRTPFADAPMLEAAELRRRIDFVKDALRREPGIKVGVESQKWAQVQTVFARGDRRVGGFIEDLAAGTPLSQARGRLGTMWDDLLAGRRPPAALCPWATVHG